VRFGDNGEIIGYSHINESKWDISDNCLVFQHAQGFPTARSCKVLVSNEGLVCVHMMRSDNKYAIAHFLVERKHPELDFSISKQFADVLNLSSNHPAFRECNYLGKSGFSFPSIATFNVVEVCKNNIPHLHDRGIEVEGPIGSGNCFIFDSDMQKINLKVRFHGNMLNTMVLDRNCRLRGVFSFEGNDNLVLAGSAHPDRDVHVSAVLRYGTSGLFLGNGGSAGHLNLWVEGPNCSVQVGDDFQFSWGIWLRTADSHGIIDLDRGVIVNPPRSIVIGPHVWLGQDVIVMPGAKIGGGTVVGARAVVTAPLPTKCVAAGVPARVIRQRTSWTRSAHPESQAVTALQEQLFYDLDDAVYRTDCS
jgi:acetyltransferase-like isoleucine patch superfamily enzyme